jgi:hypothetical protein
MSPAPASRKHIAVTGIARTLPLEFPLAKAENAGNIVHGNAPFSMFPDARFSVDRSWDGYTDGVSFRDFANASCSHLIVTVANLIRVRNSHPATLERYRQFRERLEGYDVPIVIFGLGAQSDSSDTSEAELPAEAIDLLRFLANRCQAISVRGSYTASLFAKYADDTKVFVTGCPSFYSRPEAFSELREHLRHGAPGTPAFNGTHFHKPAEKALIEKAILAEHFWIEPADPVVHGFFQESLREPELAAVPEAFRFLLQGRTPTLERAQLQSYFTRRYRLFRDLRSWQQFNMEHVSFTYGARFHVNMASLLSGRGAFWVRHDSRTRELTDTLHLPSIDLEDAVDADPDAPTKTPAYDDLFDNVDSLFAHFNEFLDAAGLPQITHPH